MNAKEVMLCWTRGTDKVALVPWPDPARRSNAYQCSALACYTDFRKMSFEQRKELIFIEAMHLIIRDGCDPMAVHKALLPLDEYQDGLAPDMPGSKNESDMMGFGRFV